MKEVLKEVKTIHKQYIAHNRIFTACVKQFKYIDKPYMTELITIGIEIDEEFSGNLALEVSENRANKALEKQSELMYVVAYLQDTPISRNKFVLSVIADTAYHHFKNNPETYIHNFLENK